MASHTASTRVLSRRLGLHTALARVAARGPAEPVRLVLLASGSLAMLSLYLHWSEYVPRSAFVPLIVLGGLGLGVARLRVLFALISLCVAATFVAQPSSGWRALSLIAILLSTMLAMYLLARAREGLGVYTSTATSMLHALRRAHGHFMEVPPLPEGWQVECAVAGAHGDTFLGDVVLASEGYHRKHAEICLVDVSGKGLRAGTRGMTVAAAFSGLLGQVEPRRFLGAANSYLVRQEWTEGFATAVHVDLDPVQARYSVSGAGHPPAMTYRAETGTWDEVCDAIGPALGLMQGMKFPRSEGDLHSGDALVLFTDGVIESRDGQLADGIDWVGGVAERFVAGGTFTGLAQSLIDSARGGTGDDRAAVVIWRQ